MRIQIPSDIQKLIALHRMRGDFVYISKQLTKSESNPEGDDTRQADVSNAVKNLAGDVEVVMAISEFYKEKENIVNQLTKKAS